MSRDRSGPGGKGPEGPDASPETLAVHAGEDVSSAGRSSGRRPAGARLDLTAPWIFDSAAELDAAFEAGGTDSLYSRQGNPTVRTVEEKLAALEGAADAVAFASGLGAIAATLSSLLASGDRLLAARDLYGGTLAWIDRLERHRPQVTVERVASAELVERLEATGSEAPAVVHVETPTNPLLTVVDLERLARAARARGAVLVVDGTFATPILQRPLDLGAHLVVHSATKFLGGHSDLTAGIVAGDGERIAAIREERTLGGACLDPHAAFLLARGMKTLHLRVERQAANARHLAEVLRQDRRVARVCYPDGPVARRQMRSGGALVSFELHDDDGSGGGENGGSAATRARAFVDHLRVFSIIPSLGGVESGAVIPATSSHRRLPAAERRALGIGDGLVRLSCGIEAATDLERDVLAALAAACDPASDRASGRASTPA